MKEKKSTSIIIIFFVYICAIAVGALAFNASRPYFDPSSIIGFLICLFIADSAATIWVWLAGLAFSNSSVYDPYWSFAPWCMLLFSMFHWNNFSLPLMLSAVALSWWSWRLTYNWAVNFENLYEQDWRYTQYCERFPKLWGIINFFGIHYMPTVVVFAALVPSLYISSMESSLAVTPLGIGGIVLTSGAALLQFISDTQMRRFRQNPANIGTVNDTGIWGFSRHPNYLGEILVWWGVLASSWGFSGGNLPLWTAIGAVFITALFIFISIPLIENRQLSRRPQYAEYIKRTGALLPRLKR